jgi:hypothetical protein
LSADGARRAIAAGRWAREERRGCLATISVELILAWAKAHHEATGRWPTVDSGPIEGVTGETWSTVNNALRKGKRRLPGPTSLSRLLVEHLGEQARNRPPDLTIEQVLASADAYHETHGAWPQPRTGGPIPGARGLTWSSIHTFLATGRRGLPGKTTLARFLMQHRGPNARNKPPELSMEKILSWADGYHEAHDRWPRTQSGKVAGTDSETWFNISAALGYGSRGLPGGSSLSRLLAEHRGVHNPAAARNLTIDEILDWADAHQRETGRWPTIRSGAVVGTKGERWSAIDFALRKGLRGLPSGGALYRLLDEHCPERRGMLTIEQIQAWGEAHRAATGRWPNLRSGSVIGAPGETWRNINRCLYRGNRGLPGGMTQTEVFGRTVRRRPAEGWVRLTIPEILTWADAHHRATGRWPSSRAGTVHAAPFPLTWRAVEVALAAGCRGRRGGQTLSRLLHKERGYEPKMNAEAVRVQKEKARRVMAERQGRDSRQTLSVPRILAAADAHRQATGLWPNIRSGPIAGLPGETWSTVDRALRLGRRGLPGGISLARQLAQQRGRRMHGLCELSVEMILGWADAYQQAHGRWQDETSGLIEGAPPETWSRINGTLQNGVRGLPGGSSLRRLLHLHRGARYLGMEPDLRPEQIAAWAAAHHAATGQWPSVKSGRVAAAPEESWARIDHALRLGRRGLPRGSTLARLMAEHLPGYARTLTLEQIVAWGEAHHAAHGRWPTACSGAIIGEPGEKWPNIEQALRSGGRGLPAGLTLKKLFACRRAPIPIVVSQVMGS